jgi:lipopolysaccharide/colanic/teichoic acid biosynthesis glycosyltransferase
VRAPGALTVPRAAEVVLAVMALVLLSPVLIVVALLVRLSSPGPVLYRQVRLGRDAVPFRLLKFRTMRTGADRAGLLTVGDDARVTSVGRFLRARRLDELPQLVNVLRGEMALVGARPEVAEFVRLDLADQREVLRHRPGLTDPASLAFRNEASLLVRQPDPANYYRCEVLPAKVRISADYLRQRSAASDVRVLLRTVRCLVGWDPRHA